MIYITGDIHGSPERLGVHSFYEQKEMTRDDVVIICGDFGMVWEESGESASERYWLKWLEDKPFTTVFVCGNHENFDRLYQYPVKEWHGGKVHEIRPHVLHLMRGEIFDIEPDQNDGKGDLAALPRRARFYHAKIDAGNLPAGEEYGKLRNVIVIFITTYDPFSENRMVYTIKNSCVEVPELEYEDGAKTIFLYTRGKEGNPPEELKQLLHYMEHSSIENASTESLKKLHRMVTAVKRDGEVGLAYMKSFEREARIRREGQTQEIIRLGRKFGKSEEEILALLQEELQISEEWAKELLEKYTL